MICYILYQKNSPAEADVNRFSDRLGTLRVENSLVEADSAQGISLSENYDLLSRPAVALVRSDGTLVEQWQHQLPAAEDVSYLAHQ